MPCNNCNQPTCNGCHAEVHICNQCPPEQPCDCQIVDFNTDCSIYRSDPIECDGVVVVARDTILSTALNNIVNWTCTRLADIQNFFTLRNVGAGAGVYKGVNLIGEKEIKSLTKTGDLVVITPSTNEVSFTIDEVELTNFVQDLIPSTCIESESLLVEETLGCFNVELDINSNTLTVTNPSPGVFQIEQPSTATIPALYVNDLYLPTYEDWVTAGGNLISNPSFEFKGTGSLAKPFTNSVRYTSPTTKVTTPNTAIQNALNGDLVYSYVGNGSAIAPQKAGQRIIIQNNSVGYTFAGNLNYQQLNLKIEGNVLSTTTGYLVNLDAAPFSAINSVYLTIDIDSGVFLQIQGDGFKNSGNAIAGVSYATGKIVYLKGQGTIFSAVNNINKYIINSDEANTGNNNDGNVTFGVECRLKADFQGVYRVGGRSRVDFYNEILSGTLINEVDLDLKAFYHTGGSVRLFRNASLGFEGTFRRHAVYFDTAVGFTSSFIGFGNSFFGTAGVLFQKNSTQPTVLEVGGSNSGYGLTLTTIFDGDTTSWSIIFRNNIFSSGALIVDITNSNTVSSINTIGGQVIETLRQFQTKKDARLAFLSPNSAFLLVKDFVATDLVEGEEYQIVSLGTTNFTLIGASATPIVGEYFTKNSTAGLGTGVARTIVRTTLL
jgi:hypothetical protein